MTNVVTASKEQLESCPFCGFTNLSINPIARIKAGGEEWRAWVQCHTCNAVGPSVSSDRSEEEARLLAVTLWNGRRINDPESEAEPKADSHLENWIAWKGGDCPVGLLRIVKVKLRGGLRNEGHASKFFWGHLLQETDIVAYMDIGREDR